MWQSEYFLNIYKEQRAIDYQIYENIYSHVY